MTTNWREGPTPEQVSRLNIQYVLVRADRQWATDHLANALPADRMDYLIRAVEKSVGMTAVRDLECELAVTRGLLSRLVEAVTGQWDPRGDPGQQAQEALRQVRRVEAYLASLNPDQEVA